MQVFRRDAFLPHGRTGQGLQDYPMRRERGDVISYIVGRGHLDRLGPAPQYPPTGTGVPVRQSLFNRSLHDAFKAILADLSHQVRLRLALLHRG
jgi:hypothetical protein